MKARRGDCRCEPVDSMLAACSDGACGYLLRRLGGPVWASRGAAEPFYPASSLKVLEHLHAARAVDRGLDLQVKIPLYLDPAQSCADAHPAHHVRVERPMRLVLAAMMQPSCNPEANALQEFFGDTDASLGRQRMNATAHDVLGMSEATRLEHKFGCGGPENHPANTATLEDLALLYERMTCADILSPPAQETCHALMLNHGNAFPEALTAVICEEAAGTPESAPWLQRRMRLVYKGGHLRNHHLSLCGWIELPAALKPREPSSSGASASEAQYVFGLFLRRHRTADPSGEQSQACLWSLTAELLRPAIRRALAAGQRSSPPTPPRI